VRSRLRARVPAPDPPGARAADELRKAIDAPLPMDEVPIAFAVAASSGATAATIAFPGDADVQASGAIALPPVPMTIAFAALTANGRLQTLGTRTLTEQDLRIEGCCPVVRQDLTIPKDAIAVRAAVYQHASGRVGSAFITFAPGAAGR
jgi:hypothetical protein